jgi:recyclin-1
VRFLCSRVLGLLYVCLRDARKDGVLNFDAMDEFMNTILGAIQEHGSLAVRVFPPTANVFHAFATRLANEVVGEYVAPLLSYARSVSNSAYLTATAAAFREAWRMVAAVTAVGQGQITQTQAEDIVCVFTGTMTSQL